MPSAVIAAVVGAGIVVRSSTNRIGSLSAAARPAAATASGPFGLAMTASGVGSGQRGHLLRDAARELRRAVGGDDVQRRGHAHDALAIAGHVAEVVGHGRRESLGVADDVGADGLQPLGLGLHVRGQPSGRREEERSPLRARQDGTRQCARDIPLVRDDDPRGGLAAAVAERLGAARVGEAREPHREAGARCRRDGAAIDRGAGLQAREVDVLDGIVDVPLARVRPRREHAAVGQRQRGRPVPREARRELGAQLVGTADVEVERAIGDAAVRSERCAGGVEARVVRVADEAAWIRVAPVAPDDVDAPAGTDGDRRVRLSRSRDVVVDADGSGPGLAAVGRALQADVRRVGADGALVDDVQRPGPRRRGRVDRQARVRERRGRDGLTRAELRPVRALIGRSRHDDAVRVVRREAAGSQGRDGGVRGTRRPVGDVAVAVGDVHGAVGAHDRLRGLAGLLVRGSGLGDRATGCARLRRSRAPGWPTWRRRHPSARPRFAGRRRRPSSRRAPSGSPGCGCSSPTRRRRGGPARRFPRPAGRRAAAAGPGRPAPGSPRPVRLRARPRPRARTSGRRPSTAPRPCRRRRRRRCCPPGG